MKSFRSDTEREGVTAQDDDRVIWTPQEQRMLKYMLTKDGIQFFRYFFKHREGNAAVLNWHHFIIDYVLELVLSNKINRLIINLPPGYTKTEIAVINFIMRGFVINPRARFIHTSYSNGLALENSSKVKDGIESEPYQELWPYKIKSDKKSKQLWYTESGGGVRAAAAGGQITGFRAGRMESGFTGALICDDPVKPADAFSAVARNRVNNSFNSTQRSRLAKDDLNPIIVIMQRIHEEDLTGFLLRGGSGDYWHHLTLPVRLKGIYKPYPKAYTHGVPLPIRGILESLHEGVDLEVPKSQI